MSIVWFSGTSSLAKNSTFILVRFRRIVSTKRHCHHKNILWNQNEQSFDTIRLTSLSLREGGIGNQQISFGGARLNSMDGDDLREKKQEFVKYYYYFVL
jgi:hypothetical protein